MFKQQKTQLFEPKSNAPKGNQTTSDNAFINASMKKGAETLSGNGAFKYETTGNSFLDQFGNLGSYKEPRSFESIASDMHLLYSQDENTAIRLALFMRMITRKSQLINGTTTETVQRGTGLKHEAIMRFLWLSVNDHDAFLANLHLFVAVGSWRDIFEMMRYDLIYHGWDNKVLNFEELTQFIYAGLENPVTSELVKKYMPQLKARSKCKTVRAQASTMIAKYIMSKLNLSYKEYRLLKSSGTAHEWQKLISNKAFDSIDFGSIHGRALMQLVSSKFIENNGLADKYEAWIEAQPVAKFTGYPHELFEKYMNGSGWGLRVQLENIKPYQKTTINKQFDGLVELGRTNANTKSGLIVVRDTSGSMSSEANGSKMDCNSIAKALALYFSAFLDGAFKDSWIEFNSRAVMHKWIGNNVVEKWINDKTDAISTTDFQKVIDLFVNLKTQGVPESDFPTGILCISDGEFNRANYTNDTNFKVAMTKLWKAGFSEDYIKNFQIILWDLRNNYYGNGGSRKFEAHGGETKGIFHYSGYDPSIIAFLTGKEVQEGETVAPKTDAELFAAAMDQEILNIVK